MNNKIAKKLLIYFSSSLLLFALLIGGAFTLFFGRYTVELHKSELEKRALEIASNLTELNGRSGMHMGLGAYRSIIEDVAMTDVWIVDTQFKEVSCGMGHKMIDYNDLPEDGEAVIEDALKGEIAFSESFSDLLGVRSITVGAPIFSEEEAVGVVLLHSPISGMSKAITDGLKMLILSVLIAMLLSIPAALIFSLRFTKPLNKMKDTALELAEGNYDIKNNIDQEDEVGQLAQAMDIMADRLHTASLESQKLEQLRRDFTANVSHELRTPVTVLRGSLEALYDGIITEPETVKEYYKQMLGESKHLERLVNDLLDLTRLQNPDFKMEMQTINLIDVVKDVVRSMGQIAKRKEIEIQFINAIETFCVYGDYARLRQMLMIIVDNSIKFSEAKQKIIISLKKEETKCRVSIEDFGYGIEKEELPYIFERFRKEKSSKNQGGTGLGLAIAKQIASRHNLSIHVESELEKGTLFTFEFNIEELDGKN